MKLELIELFRGETLGFNNGIIVANHSAVSEVGIKILKEGGNAVDAAVACSFIMGLVSPATSGIGGGGFMTIRLKDGTTSFIDYRETAPEKSREKMYEQETGFLKLDVHGEGEVKYRANSIGYMAVAVPGTLAGLELALESYGTFSMDRAIYPAIRLADDGFEVSTFLSMITKENWDNSLVKLENFPQLAQVMLNNGRPYNEGDKMIRRDLAETYRKIAKDGSDTFYRGEIASLIAEEMERNGGLITEKDLATYRPKERSPVSGTYQGLEIISSPPPSSGGTHVIQILNVLEDIDIGKLGHNTEKAIHILCEVMRRSYADRSKFMADPDFLDIPLDGLLSRHYAEKIRREINLVKCSGEVKAGDPEKFQAGNTAVLGVVDKDGNMVSLSETVECFFGSGVIVPNTGILLNDEMHDFNPLPGNVNSIHPNKRPLSSMSPTLILKDGKPFMNVASTGGRRIISNITQVLINIINNGFNIHKAINAPRFFHAEGVKVSVESGIKPAVREALEKMGYQISVEHPYNFGAATGIIMNEEMSQMFGGADLRRDYVVSGY